MNQTHEHTDPFAADTLHENPFDNDWESTRNPVSLVDPTAKIVHPKPEQEGPRTPGEELMHGLSRVAIVHQLDEFVSPRFRHPDGQAIGVAERTDNVGPADTYSVVHTGAHTAELPSYVAQTPEAQEKADTLDAVRRVVGEHAISSMKHLEIGHEDAQIDWGVAAESLLLEAQLVDTEADKLSRSHSQGGG